MLNLMFNFYRYKTEINSRFHTLIKSDVKHFLTDYNNPVEGVSSVLSLCSRMSRSYQFTGQTGETVVQPCHICNRLMSVLANFKLCELRQSNLMWDCIYHILKELCSQLQDRMDIDLNSPHIVWGTYGAVQGPNSLDYSLLVLEKILGFMQGARDGDYNYHAARWHLDELILHVLRPDFQYSELKGIVKSLLNRTRMSSGITLEDLVNLGRKGKIIEYVSKPNRRRIFVHQVLQEGWIFKFDRSNITRIESLNIEQYNGGSQERNTYNNLINLQLCDISSLARYYTAVGNDIFFLIRGMIYKLENTGDLLGDRYIKLCEDPVGVLSCSNEFRWYRFLPCNGKPEKKIADWISLFRLYCSAQFDLTGKYFKRLLGDVEFMLMALLIKKPVCHIDRADVAKIIRHIVCSLDSNNSSMFTANGVQLLEPLIKRTVTTSANASKDLVRHLITPLSETIIQIVSYINLSLFGRSGLYLWHNVNGRRISIEMDKSTISEGSHVGDNGWIELKLNFGRKSATARRLNEFIYFMEFIPTSRRKEMVELTIWVMSKILLHDRLFANMSHHMNMFNTILVDCMPLTTHLTYCGEFKRTGASNLHLYRNLERTNMQKLIDACRLLLDSGDLVGALELYDKGTSP